MKVPELTKKRIKAFLTNITTKVDYKDIAIICSDRMPDEQALEHSSLACCFRVPFYKISLYTNCYTYRIQNRKYYFVTEKRDVLLVSKIKSK